MYIRVDCGSVYACRGASNAVTVILMCIRLHVNESAGSGVVVSVGMGVITGAGAVEVLVSVRGLLLTLGRLLVWIGITM